MSLSIRICENCTHARTAPLDPNNLGGPRPLNCHRYPPAVQLMHLGNGNIATATASPQVPPGGTCGEWTPQPLSA